jgi:DNA-directed RNA polymerase specialized sigma24 family protein
MFFRRSRRNDRRQASEYASEADFQKIFSEDMAGLHLLAYLLTANAAAAEEVFVAGLEDSINGNPVFRQWARSWSQRAIIKRAIKAVAPSSNGEPDRETQIPKAETGKPELDSLIELVLSLPAFYRFVFVLSVLEGYSISESATLLACTPADIVSAKSQVLQSLALNREPDATISPAPVASWRAMFTAAPVS